MTNVSRQKNIYVIAVVCALIAAICVGIRTPVLKIAIENTSPLVTTMFVNLGAAVGMLLLFLFGHKTSLVDKNRHVLKKDWLILLGAILTGGGGTILANFGIATTPAATASVLTNTVAVTTAIIAFFIFKEKISKRLVIGIIFTTFGAIALTVPDLSLIAMAPGAILILVSSILIGFEGNFTKLISERNPIEITIIKAFGISIITIIPILIMQTALPSLMDCLILMLIGVVTTGLLNLFNIYAQRHIGAAKTSAIIGIAPLIGICVSFILYSEWPTPAFLAALLLVIPGLFFVITRNTHIAVEGKRDTTIRIKDDESPFFVNTTEEWRNYLRNYLCAFGFIVLALPFLLLLFSSIGTPQPDALLSFWQESLYLPWMISGIILSICGILLLILRKRVLCGVTFFFNGILLIYIILFADNCNLTALTAAAVLIFALILLTAKSKQKYVFATINAAYGLGTLLALCSASPVIYHIHLVFMILCSMIELYLAVACAAEKQQLPLTKYLTSNQDMDFRKCGPVLGYLAIALFIGSTIIIEFASPDAFITDSLDLSSVILTAVLFVDAMLLIFIGKMRFISVIFLGIDLALVMNTFCTGTALYTAPLILILLAVFAVMRKYSHLLVSIFLIMLAFSMMLFMSVFALPEIMTATVLVHISCIIVSIYLAFAVFSDKYKLPLF
ncbi:MAG TPA: DMT family transporter [Methanocorpusculum sp.]|nr:DMT family transporter [Methanocorpusculum sp.]